MEDDQHQAILVRQALAKQHPGWHLEFATEGKLALERLTSEPFDAVLLDHSLPDMKGLELLGEINSSKIDVAVVFLAAFGNEQMAEEAMAAGAYDFIQKSDVLYSQVGSVLQTSIQIQQIKRDLRKDQDERVRTERQAALAQLSLSLRHQINNPLAALCAYAELLMAELKDKPELRKRVQKIYDEAMRIRDVVKRTEQVRDKLTPYVGNQLMIDLGDQTEPDEKNPEPQA